MTHPFRYVSDPATRARLMDPVQVAAAYACHTIRGAGHVLGVSQKVMGRALDWHGIPRRKRGATPPGLGLTRGTLQRLAWKAYLDSDRCPPNCPGRERCYDAGHECVLRELVG